MPRSAAGASTIRIRRPGHDASRSAASAGSLRRCGYVGTITCHLAPAALVGWAPRCLPLACHVLLVETPASGLVLVDTGLGTADYAAISSRLGRAFAYGYARPSINPALAAIRQVAALGFDRRDVRHIVQTHLDLDHVGGLSDFPWAAVHVHEAELAAAMARWGARARGKPTGTRPADSAPPGVSLGSSAFDSRGPAELPAAGGVRGHREVGSLAVHGDHRLEAGPPL